MDQQEADIDCVACGYAIRDGQIAGQTTCRHGHVSFR